MNAFVDAVNAMKFTNPEGFGVHELLRDESLSPMVTKIDMLQDAIAPRQKLQMYKQVMTVAIESDGIMRRSSSTSCFADCRSAMSRKKRRRSCRP